jgi:glutamine synthetase
MNNQKYMLDYLWIGGNNELRSKTRVVDKEVTDITEVSIWNYDGSSTAQAVGTDSEVMIIPRALYNDPFRGNPHKIVLCETQKPDGTYLENSHRHWAKQQFDTKLDEVPWFGLEQEYFIIDPKTKVPLGYNKNDTQGQFYCSAGAENSFGRIVSEEHLNACIYAGIQISGTNAEVAPGQWEYQIGPCTGIDQGDQLWVSRYLLIRIAEKYGVSIDITPKPLKGDWNGSGCHANYSTLNMRLGDGDKTGLDFINEAIEKLSKKHMEHMEVYGEDNAERMSGQHETAGFDKFSIGIANRGRSVRIGNDTINDKQGYFEDRRPGSNCDPYLVTGMLFKTTIVD